MSRGLPLLVVIFCSIVLLFTSTALIAKGNGHLDVTFNQTGVDPDFVGSVVTVDGTAYTLAELPVSFLWLPGSVHNFTFNSPLVAFADGKRYIWDTSSGLSILQSDSIAITTSGNITGNYRTQWCLAVLTDPTGLAPQPSRSPEGEEGSAGKWWYDASTSVVLTAQPVTGYVFDFWDINGSSQGNLVNPVSVNMNAHYMVTAHYSLVPPLTVSIDPLFATILLGQSVKLDSNVTGGVLPYALQWYLDVNPVPGANADSWTFTPPEVGIYYIYTKVTDLNNSTAQSETARIEVISVPVGGYSVKPQIEKAPGFLTAYTAVTIVLASILIRIRSKTKK